MFDESFELSDVLAKLKRADESLAEFVAPLWPGVVRAAAWIEGAPWLLQIDEAPAQAGYYLLGIHDETCAAVLRPAEAEEIGRYLGYLTKATVLLLDEGLAYPASNVEKLQGITGPHPIHFAVGDPLASVRARYDGLNLYYDSAAIARTTTPLEELFAGPSLFSGDELLGVPGEASAGEGAQETLQQLHTHPELASQYRLTAVLETAGAVLEEWSHENDTLRLRWRRLDEVHTVTLTSDNATITSGISLAGARGFDPAQLIRLLHEHILDAWR